MTQKSGNFIKLTDWQSPIEQTSRQCWKQNACNSGLKLHLIFPRIHRNELITYSSICRNLHIIHPIIVGFHKTLDCRFRIFGFFDLMVISNKISMHNIIKQTKKILPNFHEIMYLHKKIVHFKKYVMEKVHILTISREFC